MNKVSPWLILLLLGTLAFTTATSVQTRYIQLAGSQAGDGAFKKILGEGRRLFAGQFVEMADVYLHSGFYPSIFDRGNSKTSKAISARPEDPENHGEVDAHGHAEHHSEETEAAHKEHEEEMDFMGPPHDWLEGFIRHFRITEHSHLAAGNEKEILPWLKIAVELDPKAVQTYIDTAYWLRKSMGKVDDAEAILREGLQNNPRSPEILFGLGQIYYDSRKDPERARNIWRLALRRWREQPAVTQEESVPVFREIAGNLARLEKETANLKPAIEYLELVKPLSPNPPAIQTQIDELRAKLTAANRPP